MCAHGTHIIITLLVSFLETKPGWPGPRRLSGISTWQPRTTINVDKFTKNIMKIIFVMCVFIITAKLKLSSWVGTLEMATSCSTVKRLGMPVNETNTGQSSTTCSNQQVHYRAPPTKSRFFPWPPMAPAFCVPMVPFPASGYFPHSVQLAGAGKEHTSHLSNTAREKRLKLIHSSEANRRKTKLLP